jgi:CheY-like chemotaxis protein
MQGSETILVVDDEKMVLDVGKAMIGKLGYNVLIANSGKEAVETITNSNINIDLVILDLIMPDMDGGQTFDRIKQLQPQIPVMLSSGYALDGQASEIMSRGCDGFIQKPFSLSELSINFRKILDTA